jgi:ubiquinone/menaquinone biosynthesis C-methylase UbiE/uncharacterized protein YbaR (Trm112 family)
MKKTINYPDYFECPACRNSIVQNKLTLHCTMCHNTYPIIEGVPVFLSTKLNVQQKKQISIFTGEMKRDSVYVKPPEWQKKYLKIVRSKLHLSKKSMVADLATGSGYLAIDLAKKGCRVFACDINLKGLIQMKQIAKSIGIEKNLVLFACPIELIPLKSGLIDAVLAGAILEHVYKEDSAVKEIARISKKQSECMITVPIRLKYVWPFFWPLNYMQDKRLGHLRRYDLNSIKIKFEPFGYMIKSYICTGYFMKVLKVFINRYVNIFSEKNLEEGENLQNKRLYGSSNITVILKRN